MTSKLTITDDKLSGLLSTLEKSFAGCQSHRYTEAADEYADMISALRELQERRKAEMNSEPYGFTDGDRRGMIYEPQYADRLNNPLPVYRHAQPAPEVPEVPADLTDEQIDAVLDSHGNMAYVIADKRERLRMFAREILRAAMLQAGNSPLTGIDLASGPDRSVEVRYVAPPGCVMVPKEPTKEMIDAGWLHFMGTKNPSSKGTYEAMLAAAPQEVK